MEIVCGLNQCTGCTACINICPRNAINIKQGLHSYNAVIDLEKCIHCDLCKNVCQQNIPVDIVHPILWKQGWIKDTSERKKCSSGGIALALTKHFIESGNIVCGCVFKDGEFKFELIDSLDRIDLMRGSKYVKSNPDLIFKEIKRLLKFKKVLFLGLPCQVAGLKKYINNKTLEVNLFLVDLICHGTPSPLMLNLFLNQYDKALDMIDTIEFRENNQFFLKVDGTAIETKGIRDKYTTAFLKGLNYTDNCYNCSFAKIERVSDITLGDSWGSDLPIDEKYRGISLILCQTKKGADILEKLDIVLEDVDLNKAIQSNHQLHSPSPNTKEHNVFIESIDKGKTFNLAVRKSLPKICIKQDIKRILFLFR